MQKTHARFAYPVAFNYEKKRGSISINFLPSIMIPILSFSLFVSIMKNYSVLCSYVMKMQ